MKKLAPVALALLLLAGCSAGPEQPAPSLSAPPIPLPTLSTPEPLEDPTPGLGAPNDDPIVGIISDAEFVTIIRESTTTLGQATDYELLVMAWSTCHILDSGTTVDEVITTIGLSTGGDYDLAFDAGVFVGAAVYSYCPQHGPGVEEFLGGTAAGVDV